MNMKRDGSDNEDSQADNQDNDFYKVPTFEELSNRCQQFGNPHRYILRFLMARGITTKKAFIIHYMRYIVHHILHRHYKVIEYVQAEQKDIDDLVDKITRCINVHAKDLGLEIVEHYDECTGTPYLVLVTQLQQSKTLASGMVYNQDELYLLTSFVSEMAKRGGQLPHHEALNMASALPKPMSSVKVEAFIDSLARSKWIELVDTKLCLQPRAIAELRTLLVDRYDLPRCKACSRVILNRANSIKCKECDTAQHYICVMRMFEQLDRDSMECVTTGCDYVFKKAEVETEMSTSTGNMESDESEDEFASGDRNGDGGRQDDNDVHMDDEDD